MGMLGERFPEAQFVVTGVLGPAVNAHGPNEFLDLPTARRVTAVPASRRRRRSGRTEPASRTARSSDAQASSTISRS